MNLEQGVLSVSTEGGEDHFTTIGAALEAARPGDRIEVHAGRYQESLTLDKAIELVGVGTVKEVIIEVADAPCLILQVDGVAVRGLALRGRAGQGEQVYPAVEVTGGQGTLTDCSIVSNVGTCVMVHGLGTAPLIRHCNILEAALHGISFADHARGRVESCHIAGMDGAGVCISGEADPVVVDCVITDGESHGVLITDYGRGTVERCDIGDHGEAGVDVMTGSNPLIRLCRIHDCVLPGAFVSVHGQATFEDCAFSANGYAGLVVIEQSLALIRRCSFTGATYGADVDQQCQAVFEECSFTGNEKAGAFVRTGAAATFLRCRMNHNGVGLHVTEEATALVHGCDLLGNGDGPWVIDEDCRVLRAANRPED